MSGMNVAETPGTGGDKDCFIVPCSSSFFPVISNQVLLGWGLLMQCPLWVYPRPSEQRIHFPCTTTDTLNYKALLLILSEDSTKFIGQLESLVAIHNSTHREC